MRSRPVVARLPVFPIVEGRALLFIAALLSLLVTSACSTDERTGQTAHTASKQRVLSLLPAATEVLVGLGAQERLVARTDYDDSPLLASISSLGRSLEPSAESVLGLTPDLVIFPAFTRVTRNLLELLQQRHVLV